MRRTERRPAPLAWAAALTATAALALSAHGATAPDDQIRLNDLQVIGSHNSYKAPIRPELLEVLRADDPRRARALDYAHPPLREQLALGLRQFEIDVLHDPDGDATPTRWVRGWRPRGGSR